MKDKFQDKLSMVEEQSKSMLDNSECCSIGSDIDVSTFCLYFAHKVIVA